MNGTCNPVGATLAARRTLPFVLALVLASCGGGGGDGFNGGGGGGGGSTGWVPGVFQPWESFYARCVSPRTGIDPFTGAAYQDVQGTRTDENNFLRSYSDDTYLWYDEITDRDPSLYPTLEYFDLLKTTVVTPSGTPKDQFHFTFDTDEYIALAQSGESAGYGAQWAIIASFPPREVLVAYTDPGTPATAAALDRGDEIVAVDGVQVVDGDPSVLNAAFFPSAAGESHTFVIRDRGLQQTRAVTMVSQIITSTPVQNVRTFARPSGVVVGYLLFNDHIATAEKGLYDAVNQLVSQNVDELVVDIRYNGGGFLDIAAEFAYMIAGGAQTAGHVFERTEFNDKHPVTDPVTGQPIEPLPFHSRTLGFSSLPDNTPLPSLNLSRVFVLTGADTCSASESIMNSLRGIGVEVIQIGSTTCGKPYGFYPTDNCGTTYFTIQFRGRNDAGFGDYSDGFAPANSALPFIGTAVPGCSIADDFTRDLGDPLEDRLAEALAWVDNGQCTSPPSGSTVQSLDAPATDDAREPFVPKSPWHTNRILRRRP